MHEVLVYALILLSTKLITEFFLRIGLPSVIGVILLGIMAGPVFHILQVDSVLQFLANIGILFLLFTAGLETDISHLKKQGKASVFAAIFGVFVPFLLSFIFLFFHYSFKTSYLIGLVLTATSVSISVITLIELKKLNTRSGITILGAAVMDDILAILMLSFSMIFLMHRGSVIFTLSRLIVFIVFIAIYYLFVNTHIFSFFSKFRSPDPIISVSVIFMFLFATFAHSMEIAAITGAYMSGLVITKTKFRRIVMDKVSVITNVLFVSIFFFVIGLKTSLNPKDISILFTIVLITIAIAGKILGSSIACYFSGMNIDESLKVGFGMIPRGEVALVIASVGMDTSLINQNIFDSIVLMILFTSFITPIVLKLLYKRGNINLGG